MSETPKVGAFVLETLTTGMYAQPLDTIRELVQNSFDAIREAENAGHLKKGGGRIEIEIDAPARRLRVKDNGVGVAAEDVYAKLLNVGMSSKDIRLSAGFRGIGRLATIAYCESVTFRTQAPGEASLSQVVLDCGALRRDMSPTGHKVRELSDILAGAHRLTRDASKGDLHFFEVVLDGIGDPGAVFMDPIALAAYLCQVAPVSFDRQRFVYAPKIDNWLKQEELHLPVVTLVIKKPGAQANFAQEIFKPYKTHYHTRDRKYELHVKDVRFFQGERTRGRLFWGWYGETAMTGAIDDAQVAGFRIRKDNIALGGPELAASLFARPSESYGRFNAWCLGEVHIFGSNVIPNARRDGFEPRGDWPAIQEELASTFHDFSKRAYRASDARHRPLEKLKSAAAATITKVEGKVAAGLVSTEQRDALLATVDRERAKLAEAIESGREDRQSLKPVLTKLDCLRSSLERERKFAVRRIRSNLDRKQRRIIAEILALLHEVLDEKAFEIAQAAILDKYQVGSGT